MLEIVDLRDDKVPSLEADDESGVEDDRLRLIFTCCHPALPLEGRVALTLRTLAGLTTTEIAHAFLAPELTMAKRLVRAKHKIAMPGSRIGSHPRPCSGSARAVLAVLYLLFNEGYAASAGAELIRVDLCVEAIRLARALHTLMPEEPEVGGWLALLLFQHSRRLARVDHAGDLVTLEEQDRSRWERALIDEANAISRSPLTLGRRGPISCRLCRRVSRQLPTRGRHRLGPDSGSV